ncbi:MAG: hypothetical protein RLY56_332 [Pseudomonadota bacterium]
MTRRSLKAIAFLTISVMTSVVSYADDRPGFRSRADRVETVRPPGMPDDATLEKEGARIGNINIKIQDIFDTSRPEENTRLFRLANRWHINTRESTVLDRLLVRTGDVYRESIVRESERLLRDTRYLYDATITPIRYVDGVVDLEVVTRDVWTLNPGVSFGRKGGKSTSGIEFEELNLFGRGTQISIKQQNEVDRDVQSFRYVDNQLGSGWWTLELEHSDFSDGGAERVLLERPFYALDTREAYGISWLKDERIDPRYNDGELLGRYRRESTAKTIYLGRSAGLRDGAVTRWSIGLSDESAFFQRAELDAAPFTIPADRRFVYPWAQFEWIEDDFRVLRNRDKIERNEDFQYGWRVRGRLGRSIESWGSDRNAWLLSGDLHKGYELDSKSSLFLTGSLGARYEERGLRNAKVSLGARYYHRQSDRRLFFASAEVDSGEKLDLDNEILLGGDNGLRGYPLRYRNGLGRWTVTLEQRGYTDWYPFRLVHVGAAAFVDVGGTWGNVDGQRSKHDILADAGVGLRLGNSRSALGNVLHIDLAFPLQGDRSIKSMQIIVETKKSF